MKKKKGKRVVHIPVNKSEEKPENDRRPETTPTENDPEDESINENADKGRSEYGELLDTLQRLKAEYANYQKRTEREIDESRSRCVREIYSKLLPIMDNLERAISAAGEHSANDEFLAGVELILKQFRTLLESEKIKPFDSIGEKFDPHFHDAVLLQESDDAPPDTVISEIERGYLMGDRVLRAARVVVSRKPQIRNTEQEDEK